MSSASPLNPTFIGHIASTQDALLLFEACLNGSLSHVARRPHDRERTSLIKSGNVFIYEEHSSGIKRWTDGVPWSPSRILGNFLVYRELERPFPPGEKKRAMKRTKRSPGIGKADQYATPSNSMSSGYSAGSVATSTLDDQSGTSFSKETERSLIGSLVDSYGFKEDGLVKKTVSVTVGSISHHLVSYYTVADVMDNKLITPSKDCRFQGLVPRAELITKQNFRTPIDEVEPIEQTDDRITYGSQIYGRTEFASTDQSTPRPQIPLAVSPLSYAPPTNVYNNYGLQSAPNSYVGLGAGNPSTGYPHHFAPPHSMYPEQRTDGFGIGFQPHRYNDMISTNPEPHRPYLAPQLAHRASNLDQEGLVGQNMSGISTSAPLPKSTSDTGYLPHGYYGTSGDTGIPLSNTYNVQRSLPTPTQPNLSHSSYLSGIPQHSGKPIVLPVTLPNTEHGYGHYTDTHQPWNNREQ